MFLCCLCVVLLTRPQSPSNSAETLTSSSNMPRPMSSYVVHKTAFYQAQVHVCKAVHVLVPTLTIPFLREVQTR